MKKIISIILLLTSPDAFSVNYYVSTTGNDSNSGMNPANAFLTLQHASDAVIPGDSVIVFAGIYSGFYHTTSGSSVNRIVFKAQEGTVIDTPNAITQDGINLEGASYITIEGFRLENMPRAGIRSVTNTDVRIFNNYCTGSGRWGILTGFSENVVIEQNICEYSELEHGIYHGNSADNPHIFKNTCRYNHAAGIHMNADASLGGDGIISNALVEQNIIYENGVGGGSGINCDGVQNSVIQNNYIYLNHASGISLYQIDAAAPCHGTAVINNSIVQPDDARWGLNITNGSADVVVFNNVILSDHAFRGSITADAISIQSLSCNHNVLSDRMSIDDGETNMTLQEWFEETAQDANSQISVIDEIFTYTSAEDFEPTFPGFLIEMGAQNFAGHEAPVTDIIDFSRPFYLNYDIGCFEFVFFSVEEMNHRKRAWTDIPAQTSVQLFNVTGQLIGQKNKIDWDLQKLSEAIYVFYYTNEKGETITGKYFANWPGKR